MPVEVTSYGSFSTTRNWLDRILHGDIWAKLDRFGQMGVDALAANTPVETGLTASSWGFRIEQGSGRYSIIWFNLNDVGALDIAIILQYGHGTGTGGYVQGRDYINPAMAPVFETIMNEFIKEVSR